MRMDLGWECERASEQSNERMIERERLMSHHPSSLVQCLIVARLWTARTSPGCLPACHSTSQPASQPLCPNPHLQLIGCVRLLHVQTRSCEHASWQRHNETFGTHKHKHMQKSLQIWSHAVWRKRKKRNKNRPNEREKVQTRVLVYSRKGGHKREREKVCKHIYVCIYYIQITHG